MTPPAVVGNDIVDLQDPRTAGKHHDARFLARVLHDIERAVLERADDAATALWAFWAAKESAYKVASKLRGDPPVFAHAAFSVTWMESGPTRWRGRVAYQELRIPVEVLLDGTVIRGIAAIGAEVGAVLQRAEPLLEPPEAWSARLSELLPRFTEREADAVHSLPSAAVRIRARQTLADVLGAPEHDVEIVCDSGVTGRRVPHVFLGGRPADADVSLSHHGSWIAWAVLTQKPPGR